jgi:transposase
LITNTSERYALQFRRRMVELVRAGRKPSELSKEFAPTHWSIALWAKTEARDVIQGIGGLTTEKPAELTRLRRENRQLKAEREILSKPQHK